MLCQFAIESPFRTPVMTSITNRRGNLSLIIVGSSDALSTSIGGLDEDDVEVTSTSPSGSVRSDLRPRQKAPTRNPIQAPRLHCRGLSDPISGLDRRTRGRSRRGHLNLIIGVSPIRSPTSTEGPDGGPVEATSTSSSGSLRSDIRSRQKDSSRSHGCRIGHCLRLGVQRSSPKHAPFCWCLRCINALGAFSPRR